MLHDIFLRIDSSLLDFLFSKVQPDYAFLNTGYKTNQIFGFTNVSGPLNLYSCIPTVQTQETTQLHLLRIYRRYATHSRDDPTYFNNPGLTRGSNTRIQYSRSVGALPEKQPLLVQWIFL